MRARSKQSASVSVSSNHTFPPSNSSASSTSTSSRNSHARGTNGNGPSSSSLTLSLPSRRRSLSDPSDPFKRAMQPPVNESPSARENRLRREQAAKQHSDDIDEQIKKERAALKKQKQAIKILLLGQSESGKSTTLKQFQLLHSPAAFHQERMAWRVIIYLNLIRSVRRILDALIPPPPSLNTTSNNPTMAYIPTTAPLSPSHNAHASSTYHSDDMYEYDSLDNDVLDTFAYDSTLAGYTTSYSFASSSNSGGSSKSRSNESSLNHHSSHGPSHAPSSESLQSRFEQYAKELAPLFALELRLMRQLSFPEEDDDPVGALPGFVSSGSNTVYPPTTFMSSSPPRSKLSAKSQSSPTSEPWLWNSTGTSPPALSHLTIPPSSFGGVMQGTGMGGEMGANGFSTMSINLSSSTSFHIPPSNGSSTSSSVSPVSPHPYLTASSPMLRSTASTFFSSPSIAVASSSSSSSPPLTSHTHSISIPALTSGELTLRTTQNWKKIFELSNKADRRAPKSAHTNEIAGWWEDPMDPVHILHHCAYAEYGMITLWRDGNVRRLLERKKVRMEESSGFYLNEIERIAGKLYIPQDDDILRARLKTIGVVEHTFTIKGSERSPEWKVYDVGGARSQRQAWAPYFEDVNAIIFLAPISAFDQTLAEDSRVNRLEDSMLLWRSVVSNKLLTRVSIILFLNKCDLLRAKLDAGVELTYHMPSYGQRSNDYESVSKYFRHKFVALHNHHTPNENRDLWIHLTSVTDKQKTHLIIANVRDLILRENLQNSRLI